MNNVSMCRKVFASILAACCFVFSLAAEKSEKLESAVSSKYSSAYNAAWGCHDPRIFQDDDGTYYVYSTGWAEGVQIRTSTDLVNWTKLNTSPLYDKAYKSRVYGHMRWDDEFLKWVGYAQNDRTAFTAKFGTTQYRSSIQPNSWAPTIIKQNGKYYMFHGIINDCLVSSERDWVGDEYQNPAACITLAISDSAAGPFVPAATYDSALYKNSSLVRYVWTNNSTTLKSDAAIGYDKCQNSADGSWENGFGAIDPEFVIDVATGKLQTFTIGSNTCYAMTYGSWKGGIALLYVDSETLKPVCTVAGTSSFNGNQYEVGDEMDAPADSISRNQGKLVAGGYGAAYEGSQIVYNSNTGYYYIFVSMGDLTYEYRVGVGRSKTVDGEYVDAGGASMNFGKKAVQAERYHAIGSKIIGASCFKNEYGWRCPGGQSIFRDNKGRILFANHTRTNFLPTYQFVLQIHQMFFNEDGWPVLNQNDFYSDYAGITPDGSESLCALQQDDVAGTYDVVLTERGSTKSSFSASDGRTVTFCTADEYEKNSVEMKLAKDGTVSGAFSGSWQLASDGYSVTITLKKKGTFKGVVLNAVDWARKNENDGRRVVTFTALNYNESHNDSTAGEYLFGNKTGVAVSN